MKIKPSHPPTELSEETVRSLLSRGIDPCTNARALRDGMYCLVCGAYSRITISWTCRRDVCAIHQSASNRMLVTKKGEPSWNWAQESEDTDHEKRTVIEDIPRDPQDAQQQPNTPALPEKVKTMKKSEAFPSKYLKSADLDGDLTVTIDSLEWEEVGKDKTEKPVLYFRGKAKPLILNGTNWDSVVTVTGEDDSDNWVGEKIILYRTEVPFGREMVDAIRVRSSKASKKVKAEVAAEDDINF